MLAVLLIATLLLEPIGRNRCQCAPSFLGNCDRVSQTSPASAADATTPAATGQPSRSDACCPHDHLLPGSPPSSPQSQCPQSPTDSTRTHHSAAASPRQPAENAELRPDCCSQCDLEKSASPWYAPAEPRPDDSGAAALPVAWPALAPPTQRSGLTPVPLEIAPHAHATRQALLGVWLN
jgi:hypothetical protein